MKPDEGVSSQAALRLKGVLKIFPVSRSTWLAGVKTGRFPKPFRNGRCVFWLTKSILELLEKMSSSGEM